MGPAAASMCARRRMTEPRCLLGLCTECKCLFKIKFYLSLVSIALRWGLLSRGPSTHAPTPGRARAAAVSGPARLAPWPNGPVLAGWPAVTERARAPASPWEPEVCSGFSPNLAAASSPRAEPGRSSTGSKGHLNLNLQAALGCIRTTKLVALP